MRNLVGYFLLLFLFQVQVISAADSYQSLIYYQDDTLSLQLDYFPADTDPSVTSPLLIYVHGGGFSNGNRTAGHELCKYLAARGIHAASITYTLYMKGKSFSCDGVLSEKIKAIQFAANQLWLATGFFIENQEKYRIDTSSIFIAGSSAGAETVLHAAFWDRQVMNFYEQSLPIHFKYAGLVAGAGALMDLNLIDDKSVLPVMMFHGTADRLVPYGTAAHHYCETNAPGWLMLFGSHSIFEHLSDLGSTVKLITYCGGGHGYAGAHFYRDQEPVYDFVKKILNGVKFQDHTIYQAPESLETISKYNFCN